MALEWNKIMMSNDALFQVWLAQHTKPCPKCKAPIEKNMGYVKYLYGFLFVCLFFSSARVLQLLPEQLNDAEVFCVAVLLSWLQL